MSSLSADYPTPFSEISPECLTFSPGLTRRDLQASPQTVIPLRIPGKEVLSPQISPCLLPNPERAPLIGGLGHIEMLLRWDTKSRMLGGSFLDIDRGKNHVPIPG